MKISIRILNYGLLSQCYQTIYHHYHVINKSCHTINIVLWKSNLIPMDLYSILISPFIVDTNSFASFVPFFSISDVFSLFRSPFTNFITSHFLFHLFSHFLYITSRRFDFNVIFLHIKSKRIEKHFCSHISI
jgi:hypothetical protein